MVETWKRCFGCAAAAAVAGSGNSSPRRCWACSFPVDPQLSALQHLRGETCAPSFSCLSFMSVVVLGWGGCLCSGADFHESSIFSWLTLRNLSFLKLSLLCVARQADLGYPYLHYSEESFAWGFFFFLVIQTTVRLKYTDLCYSLGTDRCVILAWVIYWGGEKKKPRVFLRKGTSWSRKEGYGLRRTVTQEVSELKNSIQQAVCRQLFWSQFFLWTELRKSLRNALKKNKSYCKIPCSIFQRTRSNQNGFDAVMVLLA